MRVRRACVERRAQQIPRVGVICGHVIQDQSTPACIIITIIVIVVVVVVVIVIIVSIGDGEIVRIRLVPQMRRWSTRGVSMIRFRSRRASSVTIGEHSFPLEPSTALTTQSQSQGRHCPCCGGHQNISVRIESLLHS